MDDVLYISWQDTGIGTINPGESVNFNTYEGHSLQASLGNYGNENIATYTAEASPIKQVWDLRKDGSGHEEL
jgi:hypothetical protein